LLDLHDFPGQGTALVGVLDPFWEEKGYIKPGEFKRFCNQTVPLARFKKRIFTNTENIQASIEVAHYGQLTLKNIVAKWDLKNTEGEILNRGVFLQKDIPIGNGNKLGQIKIDASQFVKAQKLILEITVAGFSNSWDIWVYPAEIVDENKSNVYITAVLNDEALAHLESGGSVLLSLKKGSIKPLIGGNIKVGFSSIFWNTAWTSKQAPHTLGILCDPDHPALARFPTEYHSNWQWWDAMSHSQAINLNFLDNNIQPIVRIIDDWFENRPLAMVFEAKVGRGEIIITGVDLQTDLENRPEARQLRYSLQTYMAGSEFSPQVEIPVQKIQALFKQPSTMSEAKVIFRSSQFSGFEAENILDDDPLTIWHTPWEAKEPDYPHEIRIDLGREVEIKGFSLLPRQDGITGGWISKGAFYISENGEDWDQLIANAEFSYDKKDKEITLKKSVRTRYIRFVALEGFKGQNFASLAELKVIENISTNFTN